MQFLPRLFLKIRILSPTLISPLIWLIVLRNVEVKHVGHCTDQEIHVVTVVGKAEEVRDRDLSDTEPLIQAVNLNGRYIFKLKRFQS